MLFLQGVGELDCPEETNLLPKPMIEIGGKPIIWHIMKHYSVYNIKNSLYVPDINYNIIKNYFINYNANNSSLHIDLKNNSTTFESQHNEDWKIPIIDTDVTNTAGRLKLIKDYIEEDEFLMTYGDGVGILIFQT